MKQTLFTAWVLSLALPLAASAAAPTIVVPNDTHWNAVTTGPLAGTQMVVLTGNPAKSGLYIVRIKAKDGTTFGPHLHHELENVTVVSGTLMVGLGDTLNTAKMKPLGAGAFVSIPANLHHYAMAKGETVIDIAGLGPQTMVLLPAKP